MICVGAVACSGSVQVLSVEILSLFHTARKNLTIYGLYFAKILGKIFKNIMYNFGEVTSDFHLSCWRFPSTEI
jgi:hypothetical protein